jgi:GNAT superfamily N-acetyltransferase
VARITAKYAKLTIEEVDEFPPDAIRLVPKTDSLRNHINDSRTVEQGWVARVDGKIVGLVVIVTPESQGLAHLEDTKFIEVVVSPAQRGKGIGDKLLKVAFKNSPTKYWAGFTHHSPGFKHLARKYGIRDNDDVSRYDEDSPGWQDDGSYEEP